jgi:hypothetical protein
MAIRLTVRDALINRMDDGELRNLYMLLSMRFDKPRATTTHDFSADETISWAVIVQVLKGRGVSNIPPLNVFATSYGIKRCRDALAAMDNFIRSGCGADLTRIEHQAVLRLVFNCMCDYLDQRSRPLAPRTLLDSISMVPTVINRALPGYHASKLLNRVVRIAQAA